MDIHNAPVTRENAKNYQADGYWRKEYDFVTTGNSVLKRSKEEDHWASPDPLADDSGGLEREPVLLRLSLDNIARSGAPPSRYSVS